VAGRRGDRPEKVRHRLTGAAGGLLVLALFSLLLWLLSDSEVQLAVTTAFLAGIVIDGVLAHRTVAPVRIDLRSPDEIVAGEPSDWTVQVTGWSRPLTLSPLLAAGTPDVLVRDDRLGTLTWPALRRGTVPFAVIDAKANGPLGLVAAGRRHLITLPAPVHVTPPLLEVPVRWPKARAIGFGMVEGSPIGDDLFRSVRPYRSGDERRRVHWKATAHHGELMVRESDGLGVVLIRLIVDLGVPGIAAELAASRAAWVATAALDRGWAVDLVTLDASGSVPHLASLGRAFGPAPRLADPPLVPLPTVTAPVRSARDVRRRLATTATGSPQAPGGSGWRGLTCRVSADGVEWT
jgi:uncharacterized protein (DUF58 family)